MFLFSRNDLITTAEKLLDLDPDPIPRFRLVRNALCLDPADAVYQQAQMALEGSKWVAQLQDSQLADGTWGRFHSRDSRLKLPFPTTEIAISNALDCGLDKHHPILMKVTNRILDYVEGKSTWPDQAETHDNPLAWEIWVRHFSAAVLAQIDPGHPRLDQFCCLWSKAVETSFQSGVYDRHMEVQVLNQLLECRMKDPVPFHRKYPLLILSAKANDLPAELEQKMLAYLLHAPEGIYYVSPGPLSNFPAITARNFWSWIQAHKLLSRFRSWKTSCMEAANWIWSQRNAAGFWDLGGNVSRRPFTGFPLSESWKRPENRLIDSSVEILDLLFRCFSGDESAGIGISAGVQKRREFDS
jgi:hypothetical protein